MSRCKKSTLYKTHVCAGATFKRFKEEKDGAIAMTFGLMLPVVVGVAGLGVEVAGWYETRAKASAVADIAAHAAGLEAMESADDDERIEAVALETAAVFGVAAHEMTAVPSQTDLGTRIDVNVRLKAKRYFSAVFNSGDVNVSAISGSASAIVEASGEACLVALDPDGDGIEATGNNHTVLNGCLAMSNATDSDAISLPNSNATLIAECAVAVGGASIHGGNSSESLWSCAKARTGASPLADPYAGTQIPDLDAAPYDTLQSGSFDGNASSGGSGKGKGKGKKSSGTSSTIASGRYDELDFKNTVLFEDGATVIIDGGDVSNTGGASLIGENVTIILINGAEIDLTSQATLDLRAKTTGDYAGLVVMSDALSQGGVTHKWRGGSDTVLQGAIYLPADTLELRGGANTNIGCTHFIAGEISLSGNSRLSNDCEGVGTQPLEVSGGVRLLASDE